MKDLIQTLRNRFRRAAGRSFEADMEEEIRFHLDMRASRNRDSGMNAEVAGKQARRSFGHMDGVREACRDERRFEFIREVLKDARYGWRALMRMPALTAAAALALGVGVGLMSVELSFVRGVAANMPIRDPERVREIRIAAKEGFQLSSMSLQDYQTWRATQRSFSDTVAFSYGSTIHVSGHGAYALSFPASGLTAGAAGTFGTRPLLGRMFTTEDERPTAPLAILLSSEIWAREFGSAADVVGRRLRARTSLRSRGKSGPAYEEATVIGVTPPEFATEKKTDFWVNMSGEQRVTVMARLRNGVRPETADAELATQGAGFAVPPEVKVRGLASGPVNSGAGSRLKILLSTLFGVVAGVMALACVNVGTLLTMRALERGRELALRMALGATRGRLVRQMLVESALLAGLAAAIGIPLAWAGVSLLDRQLALDESKPVWIRLQVDGLAVAGMFATSLIAALAAGLLPALRAARIDANAALKNGAWGSSLRLGRLARGMVALQSAAACALLLITGLLLHALLGVSRLDAPYDPKGVLTAYVSAQSYGESPSAVRAMQQALERARAVPGVEAAALCARTPVHPFTTRVSPRNADTGASRNGRIAADQIVSPEFFAVMQAPILQGRGFTSADREGGEPVAVVSEGMARLFWPDRSAVGRQFRGSERDPWLTVVGVCADLPTDNSRAESGAAFYRPIAQEQTMGAFLLLRTGVEPHSLIRPLRNAVRAFDPDLPVEKVFTVEEMYDRRVATPRALGALAAAFALSALALATVGIYGVTGFSVRKRMLEFGVRVALGASPRDMAKLTLGRGALQLAASLSAGSLIGFLASRPMLKSMEGLTGQVPPAAYAIILAVVAVSTFSALWLPAREAAKVDPAETLRAE